MSCKECKDCIAKDLEIQKLKDTIIQLNYIKVPELYDFVKEQKEVYKKKNTPSFLKTEEDINNCFLTMKWKNFKNSQKSISKFIVDNIISDNWKLNDKSRGICSYKDKENKIVRFSIKSWIKKYKAIMKERLEEIVDLMKEEEDYEEFFCERLDNRLCVKDFGYYTQSKLDRAIINLLQ